MYCYCSYYCVRWSLVFSLMYLPKYKYWLLFGISIFQLFSINITHSIESVSLLHTLLSTYLSSSISLTPHLWPTIHISATWSFFLPKKESEWYFFTSNFFEQNLQWTWGWSVANVNRKWMRRFSLNVNVRMCSFVKLVASTLFSHIKKYVRL